MHWTGENVKRPQKALLTEDLVLTPQPLQLGHDVFLLRPSELINLSAADAAAVSTRSESK